MYILDEAEKEYEEGDGDGDGMSVWSPKVTQMQGPSVKQRLAAAFDDMASWFEQNLPSLSQSHKDSTHGAPKSRMYLLDIQSRFLLSPIAYYSLNASQDLSQNMSLTIFGGKTFLSPCQLG